MTKAKGQGPKEFQMLNAKFQIEVSLRDAVFNGGLWGKNGL